MATNRTFEAWVNPLAFLEIDEPWATELKRAVTHESVLTYCCPPDFPSDLDSLVARYKDISTEPARLFVVPAERLLIERLVWPLRNAKAAYMLGNHLATIALCGMVAEMTAILLWEVAEVQVNGVPLTPKGEAALFGRSFEKLGQERRVEVLVAYQLISEENRDRLDRIREYRRKYLHFWSQGHDDAAHDAKACYHDAVSVVVAVIGQEIQDGKIQLTSGILRYLEKHQPPGAA